jgi:hypothetical protein
MLLLELGIIAIQHKLQTALSEWAQVETEVGLRNTDVCSNTTNRNSH